MREPDRFEATVDEERGSSSLVRYGTLIHGETGESLTFCFPADSAAFHLLPQPESDIQVIVYRIAQPKGGVYTDCHLVIVPHDKLERIEDDTRGVGS